jgi:hypothetical protein
MPAWKWLIGLAFLWGLVPVALAFTVHDQCISSDPECVFHSYTAVHASGPWILAYIGAPALISVILAMLLHAKVRRRSLRADHAATWLAVLSCILCLVEALSSGWVMLIEAVLTVWAVSVARLPPRPSDPLARSGSGYFRPSPSDKR